MMHQTKESLIRPDWIQIGMWAFGVVMFCCGVMLGRNSVEPETSVQSVPFASLVTELRVCKETLAEYDIHVDPAKYE